jgi:hypothetical protein
MQRTLRDHVRDYHRDPYFPTMLPYALLLGLRDWAWYRGDGQPRWYKPSNFSNPVSRALNRSLFRPGYSTRQLSWLERTLLSLGF